MSGLLIRRINQRKRKSIIAREIMAIYFTFLVLMMSLILSAIAVDNNASRNDLNVAIEEMQTANYFSFVMLINMLPPDRVPENITFLMPNDRMLSKISIPEDAVNEFLLRHSIPSPLLFDHLEHFPTGSMIPTYEPNYMLKVSNNGRRSFQLNNVQIISPNICTAGVSIRCHGINGFLTTAQPDQNRIVSSPICTSASPKDAAAPASHPRPSPSPPSVDPLNLIPSVAPSPNGSQKSGSSLLLAEVLFCYIMTCMILALVAL